MNQTTLLSRIVEHIPDSVVVTDRAGTIKYVNSCAESSLGYARTDLASRPVGELILDIEGGQRLADIRGKLMNGEPQSVGMHLECRDGQNFICTATGFCVRDENNEPEELVFVFHNVISERRVAEQLEAKNVEMLRVNSELIRSNEKLKHANELKTKFLSIASHELKTPLTSIKGYSEIIIGMADKVDDSVYRMIESISRAADRLHNVINNMLDIARIEQKRLRLKPEDFDVCRTARECLDELEQFTAKRGITFECSFAEDLPLFYGDKMRVQQVLINLFSNAIKFSPDNSMVRVEIRLDGDRFFHLSVRDEGIGIDKEEQKKIFDPFYEVASTARHSSDATKFMGGGTGLGLSIVKGVVERHGGRIWVESEGTMPGRFPGSEFRVLLPRRSGIQWDDDETFTISVGRTPGSEERDEEKIEALDTKPSILIIDDDLEAIEIARIVLENSFEILYAKNGQDGLALAFERQPSIILLDQYLPGLDGCRICKILRTQEETREIPVAFFSAATQSEEMERCFASGASDFIVKPFSGKELINKIWRLLMVKKENAQSK